MLGTGTSYFDGTIDEVKIYNRSLSEIEIWAEYQGRDLPYLSSITVIPSPVTLTVGSSQLFSATSEDQYGVSLPVTFTWTSSNDTVGTVNADGNFSAVNPGITMVNATNGTIIGTALVTVELLPAEVSLFNLTPSSVTLNPDQTQLFIASAQDQYGNPMSVSFTWTSSNDTVGTVDADGNFSAANPGITMVNATNGTINGTALVTVELVPAEVSQINVTPSSVTLNPDQTQPFTASAQDQNGNPMIVSFTWTSSNDTVGTVDADGNFSAANPGITMVNATNGTINGTALVTVELVPAEVSQINVTPSSVT